MRPPTAGPEACLFAQGCPLGPRGAPSPLWCRREAGGGPKSPIPPPLPIQASLWWPNEWSLVAQFENVRRADALRAALRPPPPEVEPPPPPKKSRQQ